MLNPRHVMRAAARGLSLVELMVGIAVGMFVVAAATTLVVSQLTENRKLLLEVQVQQDLRATADIITRELRRAGSQESAPTLAVPWRGASSAWTPNSNAPMTPASGSNSVVNFMSARTIGQSGPYGFRLNAGLIESEQADAGWQPLTDRATVNITTFNVTALPEPVLTVACSKLCDDGTRSCWPTVAVRTYRVDITGQSTTDASVVRSISTLVRVRNDAVTADPALGARSCPA